MPAVFGFGGTLVGAAVGAVTAFLVRSKEKTDRQITDTYSVLLRAQVMSSDLHTIKRWIDGCLALAKAQGVVGHEHWKRITSMVGVPVHIQLPTRELAVFAEAKEYAVLQDIMTLGMRHSMTVDSVETYSRLRVEFGNILSNMTPATPKSDGPQLLGVLLSEEEIARLKGRILDLETLMESILKNLDENITFAQGVVQRIVPAAREYFGENRFPLNRVSFIDP